MANPYQLNVLGGLNLGDVAKDVIQGYQIGQQREQQQTQQTQMQDLARKAMGGDVNAMNELYAMNPQLGQMYAERTQQLGAEQSEAMKEPTTRFLMGYKNADPQQREVMLQQAIQNPMIDFDEEDAIAIQQTPEILEFGLKSLMGDAYGSLYDTGAEVDKAMFGKYTPESIQRYSSTGNYADLIAESPAEKKAKTIKVDTPTGYQIVESDTGQIVREQTIPEKAAKYQKEQAKEKATVSEKKQEQETGFLSTGRALALATELADEKVIAPVTGAFDRLTPVVSGQSQDVINKALELKDLLTLENLGLMSGVLTDKDIQILARAGSGLNVDDWGFKGSEKGVAKQINKVSNMLKSKLKSAVKRGDLSQSDFEKLIKGELEDVSFGEQATTVNWSDM